MQQSEASDMGLHYLHAHLSLYCLMSRIFTSSQKTCVWSLRQDHVKTSRFGYKTWLESLNFAFDTLQDFS